MGKVATDFTDCTDSEDGNSLQVVVLSV